MKTHFNRLGATNSGFRMCAAAALVFVAASTAQAQNTIGINFAGRQWSIGGNTPMTLAASDTAGVVSQQNWNNVFLDGADSGGMSQLNVGAGNAGVVSDNSGLATSVTFSYTKNGNATEWAVDQSTHTGNRQLMDGYWDIQSASGAVSLGNIPYSVYNVYVYVSADGNGRTASINTNGSSQIYLLTDANGYDYSTNLIQATATSQGAAVSAHYVLFTNVTGASFQLNLVNYGQDVGLAAVQIVDVSGALYKPTVSIQPVSEELYAGRTAQFSVSASGTTPFSYYWRLNGISLSDSGNLFGSASNILSITNVASGNAGNYDVVITNSYGSTTSTVAQLTVVTPTYAYEQEILSNSPVAYYRLNENSDTLTYNNLPAFDYIGGANGVYGVPTENLFYGISGPVPSNGYPGFETGNGAVEFFSPGYPTSQITVPSWNISTNTVTIAAWIYPLGGQQPDEGLVFNRGANVAGLDYSGSTNAAGDYTLGYTWNNDPVTFFWNSGLVPPADQWSLVVLVVTPSDATLYLANTNGISAAVQTYPHVPQTFAGPIAIGNDPSAADGSRVFNGEIDEVAVFNQALTQAQVLSLFSSASGLGNFAPAIANQPSSQAPPAQENVRFSVAAVGSAPLGYQWQAFTNGSYVNVNDGGRISGSRTATLMITNVSLSDPTNYIVIITNAYGSVTSSPVALTVTTSSYASTVLASGAIAYYALNETGNPAAGGLTAYDYLGGFNGIYGTDVQNGYNGVAGPRPPDGFSQFLTNNWAARIIANDANGHLVVSPWNLNTNTVTLTCWIRPASVEPSYSGLVFSRDGAGTQAGLNFSGNTDASGNRTLSYTWGDTCCWDSQLAPPTNQWSFVALVVTPTNATIYVYNTNGTNSATLANTHSVLPFSGVTGIGVDPFDATSRNFDGVIDEVAVFNKDLSPTQLAGLYQAGVKLISNWDGTNLTLNWTGGILLQSTNVTGPWTTNANVPPVIVNPKTSGPRMFYRVQGQ